MEYIEVNFTINPVDPWRDLLAAELGEIGYESFVETDKGLLAYVPASLFKADEISTVDTIAQNLAKVSFTYEAAPDVNWNEEWEKHFDPIVVGDQCVVRATFHKLEGSFDHEIIIDPKMAFGTGHHATTYQIIQYLLERDYTEQYILDMGCGTGVLAILASMRGAKSGLAIDIDDWAYRNTVENFVQNKIENIEAYMGGVELLEGKTVEFDTIIANINKNIILAQLEAYARVIKDQGELITSGFYQSDIEDVKQKAEEVGFVYQSHKERENWVAVSFIKK